MTTVPRPAVRLGSFLGLEAQRALLQNRAIRLAFILFSCALIIAQQASFLLARSEPDPFYRNVLNLGASYQRYFAFYYYFHGFPVNLDNQKTRSLEEMEATLTRLGPRLTPERDVYNRASIFLFYPDAYWKGRPDTAEMRTGLAICFTLALLAVFAASCDIGLPLFGLLVALLCGSDPFQVYELYHWSSSTIFPTVISTGLLTIAIALVLSNMRRGRRGTLAFVLVAAAGALCSLQYEVRLEGVGVFIGLLASLLCCSRHSKMTKAAYICLFIGSMIATNVALDIHFKSSFERANAIVARYGGRPADSGNAYYATQWWALWSGLGDFDEKYGFLADDRAGISYYYGHGAPAPSEAIHRRNYIGTILNDPVWFVGIIRDRLTRVLLENTPYRLSLGPESVDIKVSPTIVTVLGVVLLLTSAVVYGKERLNLFILPLSIGLVSVGQLADYGLQFYAIAHLFLFAYVACCLMELPLQFIPGLVPRASRSSIS